MKNFFLTSLVLSVSSALCNAVKTGRAYFKNTNISITVAPQMRYPGLAYSIGIHTCISKYL